MTVDPALVERAAAVTTDVVAKWAARVDADAHFPVENLAALHDAGLMAVFLPRAMGGQDASVTTYATVTATIAEACASTAMIWAMHGQQSIALLDHAADTHHEWLEVAGSTGCLIGSVTTDPVGGADIFTTGASLNSEGDLVRVRRDAPIVSGGAHAGFFLVTMRASPDGPQNRTCLVCVSPQDGVVEECGVWDALGMRGTHSVPMRFDVAVDPSRVVRAEFADVAGRTMIPVGHVGWASCWFGAARGAASEVRRALRSRGRTGRAVSDLACTRLAEVQLSLDLIESIILRVAQDIDQRRSARRRGEDPSPPDAVLVNNVKLAASRLAFDVVDELMEIAGIDDGYRRDSAVGLERTFRDLRSATLMFHNDRLLHINGRIVLVGGARPLVGSAGQLAED